MKYSRMLRRRQHKRFTRIFVLPQPTVISTCPSRTISCAPQTFVSAEVVTALATTDTMDEPTAEIDLEVIDSTAMDAAATYAAAMDAAATDAATDTMDVPTVVIDSAAMDADDGRGGNGRGGDGHSSNLRGNRRNE